MPVAVSAPHACSCKIVYYGAMEGKVILKAHTSIGKSLLALWGCILGFLAFCTDCSFTSCFFCNQSAMQNLVRAGMCTAHSFHAVFDHASILDVIVYMSNTPGIACR